MSKITKSAMISALALLAFGLADGSASAQPYHGRGWHHGWHHGPGFRGWHHHRGPWGWHRGFGPGGWHHRHWR